MSKVDFWRENSKVYILDFLSDFQPLGSVGVKVVMTNSNGLIKDPQMAQLKHKAAKIMFAPFQPYKSSK